MKFQTCYCGFCIEPERPMYSYPNAALKWLSETTDDQHKRKRVQVYIEIFYRAGVWDPRMAYCVWILVMGTDVDPPFAKNGIGAFQPQRMDDGTLLDPQWPWWNYVGRRMPWNEEPESSTLVRDHLLEQKLDYEEWLSKKRRRRSSGSRGGSAKRYRSWSQN